MNEIALTRQIQTMIRREFPGVYVQRVSDRFLAGIPDLRLISNGMSGDLEIKFGKGKTSKIQDKVIERIRAAGGSVGVVWSVAEAREWVRVFVEWSRYAAPSYQPLKISRLSHDDTPAKLYKSVKIPMTDVDF